MEILPIGSALKTNLEGCLISESHMTNIVSPWLEAIKDLKKSYLNHFRESIHSIYVRGSVARGKAIESFSDIDTVTVLTNYLRKSDNKHAENIRDILEEKYPFATEIAHDFILYDHVMGEWENDGVSFNYAFTIKTQCACIYGQDLSSFLPQFKPNKHTAIRLLSDLDTVFKRATNNILYHQEPAVVRGWCRWVMKAIIRNAFLMVMEREKVFTRDLFPCCQFFSKHFPQQEIHIKQALEYAINPIADPHKVIFFLEDFGVWVKNEIDKEFLIN